MAMAGEITSTDSSNNLQIHEIVPLSNGHHFITIKLNRSNYLFWRTQTTLFLKAQNLIGFVDGTYPCPPSTHSNYAQWVQQDQLIMSLLIASLSEFAFPKVIGLETSHDIWVTLEKALADNVQQVEVQAIQTSSGFAQMDPILYESVQCTKLDVLRQNKHRLHAQLTPNNNTLLHVLAQFHDSAECVDEILCMQSSSVKQSMLLRKNSKDETAVHIAARNGRSKIVQALIDCAKELDKEEIENGANIAEEMMRATDQNGDTALHMAVRNKHAQVAQTLIKEDPDFPHPLNKMEETPLYLAAESNHCELVDSILTCKSPSYEGPGGKSALHAAVPQKCRGCISELLKRNQDLTKEVDEHGWSPLHYAALLVKVDSAKQLLEADRSAAYIMASKDDNWTPLHVAASAGRVKTMEELLKHCPDCWEMTTNKGQNVLHIAIDYEEKKVINFILSNSWAANLINEKDVEGNTPLHLYAISLDLDVERLVGHLGADTNPFNRQNITPFGMLHGTEYRRFFEGSVKAQLRKKGGKRGFRNFVREGRERYRKWKADAKGTPIDNRKHGEFILIVAILIATVTFAAGFTLPGGYDGNQGPNQGMAILAKNAAFKAFVVSDTIAVSASLLAVSFYFVASLYHLKTKVRHRVAFARLLILISAIAMAVAFMTGLFAVLAPSSLGLAITVCFVVSFCFLIMSREVYRLQKDVFNYFYYYDYDGI